MSMDVCTKDYRSLIKDYVKDTNNSKILDVGCGLGDFTSLLKGLNNRVFGTDIVDVRQNENKKSFSFFLSPKDKISFSDDYFDFVTNFDVIEHVEDDTLFVNEIYRVTKPGGLVVTITPNKYRVTNLLRTVSRLKPLVYPMKLGEDVYGECIHMREYTFREIEGLFRKVGFSDVKVKPFWLGVRCKILENIRIKVSPLYPFGFLSQYIVVEAKK